MRIASSLLVLPMLVAAPAAAMAEPVNRAEIEALKAEVSRLSRRIGELEVDSDPATAAVAPGSIETEVGTAEGAPEPPIGSVTAGATNWSRSETGEVAVPAAPLDRALQSSGAAFQVSASSGASDVSIKLSSSNSDPGLRGRPEGWASYTNWTVTASAPLSSAGPTTDIGTLDGFTHSSKLKLKWSQFRLRLADPRKSPRYDPIRAEARRRCLATAGKVKAEIDACNAPVIGDDFIADNAPELHDEYLRLGFPHSLAFAYGLEATFGYKKFKFLDAATATRMEKERFPWGARAFFSLLPSDGLRAITFAGEYQRSFKEQDPTVVCPVVAGAAVLQCLSGAAGAPKLEEKLIASVEYRHLFEFGEGGILRFIGVSPQLSYDALNDQAGFDLPVYLATDDKGQMIGGIRFGYTTKDDDVVVGVFVGSAFSLFGG